MSVGGWIIDKRPMVLTDDDNPNYRREVVRYWVLDRHGDETCVFAEPAASEPGLRDEIWWHAGKIMFDHDRQTLTKVGFSFTPEAEDAR